MFSWKISRFFKVIFTLFLAKLETDEDSKRTSKDCCRVLSHCLNVFITLQIVIYFHSILSLLIFFVKTKNLLPFYYIFKLKSAPLCIMIKSSIFSIIMYCCIKVLSNKTRQRFYEFFSPLNFQLQVGKNNFDNGRISGDHLHKVISDNCCNLAIELQFCLFLVLRK